MAGDADVLPQPRGARRREADEPQTHLATRIPRPLHRRVKLFCFTHEVAIRDFTVAAIREALGRAPDHR